MPWRLSSAILLCLVGLLGALQATATPATQPMAGPATAPALWPVRVAIYTDVGATARGVDDVTRCLAALEGRFVVTRVTAEQIRTGALDRADVLVQGGGGASKQAAALAPEGREKVRQFVERGGGYVGICAGAYLATTDYTWSLGVLNAKVLDRAHWNRGSGEVQLTLTPTGRERLGIARDAVACQYYQGPLLAPGGRDDLPAYESLATYASEIAKNGAPTGVMKGTTAIAVSSFGRGRVVAISPHPERSTGLDGVIRRSVAWAAGRELPPGEPAPKPLPATRPAQ